jgi:hypothetical protein
MTQERQHTVVTALRVAAEVYDRQAADRTVPVSIQVQFREHADNARLVLDQLECGSLSLTFHGAGR